MAKKVYFRKYKLNEDVNIPPELSDDYLSVKKQIEDKMRKIAEEELKFADISKKISQLKSEISIYQKNLIAIENKAKAINKEFEEMGQENTDGMQKSAEEIQKAAQDVINTIETSGNAPSTNESLDLDQWWEENVSESIQEENPDIELAADDV
jgi:septal ring factor EnvC (AmiA/AmiB activator)